MTWEMTSRETATAIWLFFLLIFVLRNKVLREGLGAVLTVIFRGPVRRWSILLCLYVILLCIGLSELGLWNSGDLKATLIWLPTAGLYMVYRTGFEQPEPRQLISRIFREGFKLSVILEFLISNFTFPFLVEFCLVPMAAFLAFIAAPGKVDDPRARLAERFADNALTLVGLGLLLHATIQTALNWHEVWQSPTALALLLPILLSILTIPFLWALLTYMSYQDAFLRVRMLLKDSKLPRCFKLRLFCSFGIRYHEVRQWWRYCVAKRANSPEALRWSLTESLNYQTE